MKLDILGGTYRQEFLTNNSQRTINWYGVLTFEDSKEDNKNKLSLCPFKGLSLYTTLTGRYFRALTKIKTHTHNRCFAVVDNILYEVYTNGSAVSRGTMSNLNIGASKVYLIVNANNQVGIFSYSAGYYYNLDTNTLTQITSTSYPNYVDYVDFLDGYTIVVSLGAVYYSSGNDLTSWNLLNTFSPSFKAAGVVATVAYKEQLINFTAETIETYLQDGTSPFSRLPRSTIMVGLKAKDSLVVYNDGFLFVGEDKDGEFGIMFYDGNQSCIPFSPNSITSNWRNIKDSIKEAYAYLYKTKTGQVLYTLTIPALQTTYCVDTTSKLWVERQSKQPYQEIDGQIVYREFRGMHHCTFKGLNLFGDLYSGKLFLEDSTVSTEDSEIVIRERTSQTYNEEFKNIPVYSLELDCLTGQGTNPNIMIQVSKDGGYTWSDPRLIPLGALGDHRYRARLRKLGTSRNWTIRLTYSEPYDLTIQNAVAHGTVSVS